MFKINVQKETTAQGKIVITFVYEGNDLSPKGVGLAKTLKQDLHAALKLGRFTAAEGQTRFIDGQGAGGVLVVGAGKAEKITEDSLRKMGIEAGKALWSLGVVEATVLSEALGAVPESTCATAFAEGIALGVYNFYDYRTNLKDHQKPVFETLNIVSDEGHLGKSLAASTALLEGVEFGRALVNHPANVATPLFLVEQAKELKKLGLKVDVFGPKELQKLGCGMMHCVGQGSEQGAHMVVLRWQGGKKTEPTSAIVGKGVTFDTGGYNIKVQSMEFMKSDMAGAAAVLGAMKALALRKSPVNVVGVVGLAENMVSARAIRPSDIVKSYKGLTVEVNNTDAEGRLVLGDALAYIIDKENPKEVVDIATLTGAISLALGNRYAGLFSNNDNLADRLRAAGEQVGEPLWRMPTDPAYHAQLKSSTADLSNMGGRTAGACTAAAFLEEFVGQTPWAHLDIAGVAMAGKVFGTPNNNNINGANAFGVRLLVRYLEAQ